MLALVDVYFLLPITVILPVALPILEGISTLLASVMILRSLGFIVKINYSKASFMFLMPVA